MPRTGPILATLLGTAALAGCGGGAHFANRPRPAVPVDLSVFVDQAHVSVSPAHVGAGPLTMYVTNQATANETVRIIDAHGNAVASSGQVNSGETAQINTELGQGSYRLIVGGPIPAAVLHIGAPRPSASNALLQP